MIAKLTRDNIETTMLSIGKKYKARKKKVKESNSLKEDVKKYEDEELYFSMYVDGAEYASKTLFEDLAEILAKALPTIPKIENLEILEYQSFKGMVCTSYLFQKEQEPAKQEINQVQTFQPQQANLGNIPEGGITLEKVQEMLEKQRFDMEFAQLKKDLLRKDGDLADAYKEIEKLENQLDRQAEAAIILSKDSRLGNQIMNGIEKSLPMLGQVAIPLLIKNPAIQGILDGLAKAHAENATEEEAPEEDKDLSDEQEGLLSWAEQISQILGADNFQKVTIICNFLAQNPEKIATVMDSLK